MKHKIQLVDKTGKVLSETSFNVRSEAARQVKKKHSVVFKNKKAYTRKEKHKRRINDDSSFFLLI